MEGNLVEKKERDSPVISFDCLVRVRVVRVRVSMI